MKFTKYIYISLLIIFSSSSYSAPTGLTGWREISQIGCHLGDGTCYVTLSGEPFGAYENCPSKITNVFRFNSTTVHGRRAYASFYGAKRRTSLIFIDI